MNAGIFKLVFSKRLSMFVPMAEALPAKHGGGVCRSRNGKTGFRTRIVGLAGAVILALSSFASPVGVRLASAQTLILPDGRTQTVVGNTGTVYNVSTSTTSGSNAFNSFSAFNVGSGNTVNLHVPSASTNLINIVRDQRTEIYGILNAIKDGRIGGNVWFANPHGFVVGASGVVNVGSLTVTTPTQAFVDGFFTDGASVGQLMGGTAPRNTSGLISIQGKVNAIDGVKLDTGSVAVAGAIYSGARFVGSAPDFSDVVNANGLDAATNVVVREGRIEIVADNSVTVSGVIAAPGGVGVRGGDIGINAGGNVELNAGANLSVRGNGANSAGGTVNIWADNNAIARRGALVDASAGSSGDGGFVEFSAKNTVELAGGEFRADGMGGGKAGSVLIDPINIVVSADILRGAGGYGALPDGASAAGANLTLLADEAITVNDGVTISTRSVDGTTAADHDTGASTGNSGSLSLEAATISLKSGSKLLAGADNSYTGGDVTLKATRNWTGEAKVSVDNATITGRNVSLTANATYNDSILTSWLPVVVPVTVSTIDVNSGTINASGTLNLAATSFIDVSSSGLSPLGMITAVSAAAVDVRGASVLTAAGNTTLASSSTVTSKATPGGPNPVTLPGDAGVAINVVVSTAKTRVGDNSSIIVSGGALDLTAKNAVTATTTADSTAGGAVAIGGTLALSEVTSVTQAVIDGSATTSSAALKVGAESTSVVTTSAKAASKGAKKQTAAEKAAAPSKSEETLAKYKDQTTTPDGSVDVAAAVAIANVNNVTLADMASTGTQTSTGAATVSSKASTASTVTADGSSASGTVGVGAAVGVNIGVLVNQARVADNARVSSNGLTVSAVMPTAEAKNSFVTTATSGAGASNVGVAGALAANVLVNTTVATVEGNKDGIGSGAAVNANGGDLVVEATNTAESKVTAGASVKPASGTQPAATGIGASVGMNVGVNTTVAEIGDGAGIGNAKNVGLTAKGLHTLDNAVTGGAAGANVAVTPVAAITVAANTTTARLGTGSLLNLSGAFTGSAEQTSTTVSTATGQTQGNNVAVGASVALNNATDTVVAEIDRDIAATGDVAIGAKSVAKSSASSTASVKGGEKATDTGAPPVKPDGSAGKTVDEKVTAQGDAAKVAGKKTADTAAASSPTSAGLAAAAASSDPNTKKAAESAAANSPASAGLAVAAASGDSKTKVEQTKEAPKTADNTESGGVAVAAAVGVNVGVATTVAKVSKGRTITSSNGALKVTSANETDTSAKADGSQVDPGNTDVGVGAAVALNAGISTNVAVVSDEAVVNTKGLTISAVNVSGQKSDAVAKATSGAGAGNVGIAGSLAASVAINTTVAALEGDTDNDDAVVTVNAGTGDILIEAANASTSSVDSGAKVTGTGGTAKVGIGASLGVNVGVNTTVAEVADEAKLTGGNNLGLNATGNHILTTNVTGGASGAQVSVTPLVAATVAVNTTTARLGDAATDIGLTGKYSSTADQTSSAATTATGQTQGNSVAVGASIGLTVATDTVVAEIDRDVTAANGVEVGAKSVAKSSTSATASVKGGEKAKDDGTAPAPGGGSGSGQSVDQKVAGQQSKATTAGKATAAKAPATTPAGGSTASTKLDTNKPAPPKAETSEGGVSVAAAVGVNVGVATTVAKVSKGRTITSSNGALKVTSANETDTSAKADGSQVDPGNTDVGIGAAVALNAGISTNVAVVSDEAVVSTKGLTVSAINVTGQKSDSVAEAKSGAGAGNVGVAGSLAANVVVNTTVASIEGDENGNGTVTSVAAGSGDVLVEAGNASSSTVSTSADVKGTDDSAKVGVGASVGVNVAVNTTVSEIGDGAILTGGRDLDLKATADHAMNTSVAGGAAGAKVSVTPVAAVSIAVNTTTARADNSTAALGLSGTLSAHADQTDTVTTKATGRAQGDVAVGASLAAAVVVETVSASVERDVGSSDGIDLGASSESSVRTEAVAGAKGAKAVAKDPVTGEEKPEAGTTVDEQKKNQLDFAKSRNEKTATLDTDTKTPKAETPEVNKNETTEISKDKNENTTGDKKQESKKVSVAAAIGVGVVVNQARATIGGAGRSVRTTGDMKVKSTTDTNYETMATGEAVSDNIGVAAAVALTGTFNKTQANVAAGTTVVQAGDINVIATANQNRDAAFRLDMAAEAVSGASGGDVAVAGSLAVVGNYNETRASIDEGVTIGTDHDSDGDIDAVGNITVKSDETSKLAARARAGSLSTGKESKAGVGASFAAILAYNKTTAAAGYDTLWGSYYTPSQIHANSLTVAATKHRVEFASPLDSIPKSIGGVQTWVKNFDFDTLDPLNYLGSNNYYTEAVAGAAAKGDAAVAGAFSVNLFMNTTEAYLGKNVHVTTSGRQAEAVPGTPNPENLGVEVAARSDTKAIAFAGAVAGAKQAGVGISNTDIVNYDETNASIGGGAIVKVGAGGTATDNGVKVSADASQVVANVSVSGGVGTGSTGVGGVLGVNLSMNKAEASIADAAQVQAEGNVTVAATNDTTMVMIAGGVGGGKEVGVGGAIALDGVWNRTLANIGKDAVVDAKKTITVAADADETVVSAVVSGAGGGKAGVAAALSLNLIVADTEASVGQGTKLNTSAGYEDAEKVAITARDDTVVVGVSGGGAGAGDAGVGAALDTAVVVKKVKAFIADDTVADGKVATVKADKEIAIDAAATEAIVSIAAGFAGGGKAGVGGSVSIGVVANDVQAYVGKSAAVDTDGNVLVSAQDDTTAVLTAMAAAGGGKVGVGGSLAVATLVGSTQAYVGESAQVNARGLGDAASVYTGETGKQKEAAKGLSVTAYNTENVVTTDVSGAGGGSAGVAVSVSANVIANKAEAYIGRSARINESNAAAGADQQVRVKAIDETVLVNNAGGAGFGGSAGVGAAANLAVIVKTTKAWIGSSALVNAKKAVELGATSSEVAVSSTLGFAVGGSAGVGASLGGVGLGNTTEAYIEDAANAASAAKVNVSGGDLSVEASDLATTTLLTGGGGGGGSAGVGGAIAVNVNASTTRARIGNFAETNATGTTAVHADSIANTNTVTVAGAGGGSAGVGGAASIKVVVSKTEAGIGDNAKVNQDDTYKAAGQNVDVKATDKIITVGVGGVGAGGGAAGVGGSADITVVLNTTSAYIGNNAKVSAVKDVTVDASSEKYVNSATFAGAGGGSAGVAGGISIISVGSLLDGESTSGLSPKDENGNPTTTQKQADDLTTASSVGDLLGGSAQSQETKGVLDGKASKMAISSHVGRTAPIDFKNTQAFIGNGAVVKAGEDVTVSAKDTTLAILAAGAGAGGGAAGVAGTLGVVLLHDSAEAFIADNAKVDAGKTVAVNAQTGENVFNVAVTGAGAGAAAVNGSVVVNVVSSDTSAYIGAADINKDAAMDAANATQSVDVSAKSSSNLVAVAGAGNGAGAAAVGGVLNVNTLVKRTKAYIARDADVAADENVKVAAESAQNVVAVGASFGGAGAAAVSAAAEVNVVANVTEAFIGAARGDADKSTGAVVDSDGNVSVSAVDDTLVVALSAVGNGAGAAAVGGIVGANVITSQTRAYVSENSAVNARGGAAGTEVYSGSIADATAAQKPPAVPGGGSGDIDIDRDGVTDGNVGNGAVLDVKTGEGTQSTVNPGAAKDADGNPIAGASGGLGTKGTETVKGLSVLAMGNEKIVTATIGVAGAGAAAVTGAATANVIASETEASIKDGAQINMSGATGTDAAVRVRAADNTFMVQAGGTVTGAGAAAVSGTVNTGIVAKKTTARIGDADVKASDVEVTADSSEKIFTLTANVSIAGAAGVGAGVGVNVIANETSAGIGAGANIDATGDIDVEASQNSLLNINTVAVAGGIAGVGGAFSVGVIANKTKAYVEGSDDLTDRTTLNAGGTTAISAASEENLVTATVSGAGGVAGVTGAFGVKVVKSDTDAYIGKNSIVTADEVEVDATDTIRVVSVGGAATGGLVGVGGTVDATIVLNTTSAHIDSGAEINAAHNVKVAALSDRLVNSTTFAGSGGAVGVAGAVSIVSVGSLLDGEAKSGLNGDDTGSLVDTRIKEDKVSTQLGNSEHVQGVKTEVANQTSSQGVANDLKGTTPPPLKNTMAFIGSGAKVKAGDDVTVTATDKTLAVVSAGAGAVGLFAGVAGTVGVVLLHDSAEAFVANGAEVDAGKTITVAAETDENVVNTGITGSGAAGVAAGGSVVVNVVTSDTAAYIGDADINRHSARNANQSVAVTADSASNIVTVAGAGGVAGGASIGGVINVNALSKETKAYIASGADVAAGKNVDVVARSAENVVGAGVTIRGAGLGAAGAVISANVVDNKTEAYIDDAVVDSDGNVKLSAVDDTLIVAVSAVANGAGGMGVGLNVGANVISNETRAYVSGASEINARGNAAGTSVYTGEISSTPGAMPALPAGASGSADIDRDGTSDGSVSGGASFNVGGKTIDPAATKASDGSSIAGASGGLGAKGEETVKGLSVVAMNNEKVITATVGVAVAGGRSQTGASTANVISSVTEASIGDGAQINMSGAVGADPSVRVRAADNTLMVQVGGTFAGAGAMGLSGAINSGIVTKQTTAYIGDADIKASNVEVTADSSEDIYNVTVNAALAGGAGVGGAAGVDVIRNQTFAGIGANADIDATENIRVNAKQHSAIDLYTVSGAVAGLVGVSGAVSVGVIANETKAYVEDAATLNAAGTTAVIADSSEKITSVTVSGAAGGLAGVAGAVGVKVVESKTEAFIGDNARVNQTRNGAAQDVIVSATDVVTLRGGGGTVALAGYAGVGATAEVNIVRNTTTAYIGDGAWVDADRDVSVSAASTKDVQSAAIAASGGLSVGIGGAVSVVTIGAKLDDDSQGGLRDPSGGGNTASSVDSQISKDEVSGQLGGSEHVQGMKTEVSGGIGSLGVAAKMNESSAASLDKTRAYIGGGSKVKAGDDVTVAATDKVKLDIRVAGAAGGFVGIGGALGVGVVNSTTEAFVGASAQVEAGDELTVEARTENLDANGSKVVAVAGAGGIIGLGAAVAVMNNTSSTHASVGNGSTLTGDVTVSAETDTKQFASASGIAVGVVAVGASIASVGSDTDTRATLGSSVIVTGDGLAVLASGTDDNFATATAGSGGLVAGSAAAANTTSSSNTIASVGAGDGTHQASVGSFEVSATHTTRFNAEVDSVNASLAGASGANASHTVDSTVLAEAADDARVLANDVRIVAENRVEKNWLGGSGDSAAWNIRAGSGGVIGAPAGKSETLITQDTKARVGDGAKIHVLAPVSGDGVFRMDASNVLIARDKAKLDSGGAIAIAKATSLITVDRSDATTSFGTNSEVISDVGSIDAGSRNDATIETRAAADTYGLAGAPDGSAHSVFRGDTNTVVGSGAMLRADDGAVNLAAGRDSSGNASRIDARSAVNLWNKTAIPIPTLPDALTRVVNNANVSVLGTANVKAAGDITLTADRGSVLSNAIGIGKDIYRETLAAIASGISNLFGGDDVSFDVRGGTSSAGGFAGVRVDGNVETGIYKDASLTLDVQNYNSTTRAWDLKVTRSRGVAEPTIEFQVGIAADINKRRALLVKLSKEYSGTAAGDAYDAEISFLDHKLVELGLAYRDGTGAIILGTGGGTGISPRAAALTRVATLTTQKDGIVNNLLPLVVSQLDAAATALDTYDTVFLNRSNAISLWATEAAKGSPDADYIAARKTEVASAESTLTSRSVTGWVAQGAAATPNLATANNERSTYNTSVVQPLQVQVPTLTTQKTALETQRDDLTDNLFVLNRQITGYTDTAPDPDVVFPPLSNVAPTGPAADFVTVPNIKAQLGSIRVTADALTGAGKLKAPGDARVTIINNTPDYLIVKDIEVDADAARVAFNGVDVASNADISRLNRPGHTAGFSEIITGSSNPSQPEVTITSTYDPNSSPYRIGSAPDIRLTGNISNPRGLVQVHSAAGSILSQGNIYAGTVDIKAANGDFVQSYVDNFFHIGGDPKTIFEGTTTPGGIVANGSVFISSRYLNINGIIQSGVDSYTLTLPAGGATLTGSASMLGLTLAGNNQAAMDAYRIANPTGITTFTNDRGAVVTYNAAKNRLEVSETFALADAASVQGKARNPTGEYTLVSDYGNIGARYDTANDRYLINGTEVKGGYIQLFGQILNTAAGTGTGKLRVLDGYGQINIANPSGKDIVLARLDAGQGTVGVIDITDIQYVDANKAAHSIKSLITRENGSVKITQKGRWTLNGAGLPVAFDDNWTATSTTGSVVGATGISGATSTRSAAYNPQPGLAFTYTTGQDQSTYEDFSYQGTQFIGISAWRTWPNLTDYRIAGPYKSGGIREMEKGRYLSSGRSLANSYHTSSNTVVTNGPAVLVTTNEYSYCDWWSLCITQTYHIDFSRITPTKDIVSNFLRADNPIGIEFIGADSGTIGVRSAQNAILTGAISNKTGTTTIIAGDSGTGVTAANKNIVQGNDEALIRSKDLILGASGSIGATFDANPARLVRAAISGTLNAAASNGNVMVRQTLGDLKVGTVTAGGSSPAGTSRVTLQAEGSIVAAGGASRIEADRVDLSSDTGSIGSIAAPLLVNVGYTDDTALRPYYGLKAAAQGDIGVATATWAGNTAGNLLVDTVVSAGGDVKLVAPGRIIDNNPIEQVDTRTWAELLAYWDSLGLREGSAENAAKQQQAIKAFEFGKTANYRLYWQMRQRPGEPAGYNPSFVYTSTPAERAALTASGMTGAQITTFENNRSAQYHQLNTEVGTLNGGSFADGYAYTATTDERNAILHKASWSERELAISVSPGLLKNLTNTNPVIKSANVQGKTVALQAGVAIGETSGDMAISTSIAPAALTDAQKVALAAAERADISITDSLISVRQRKPFNFDAATGLNVSVTPAVSAHADNGNAFLASLGDGLLGTISVPGDTRVKVHGSILNAPASLVQTGNLILEAANGGVGYIPSDGINPAVSQPLQLSLLPGATLTARGAGDVDIVETGSLNVDTVFSRGRAKLTAAGSILDAYSGSELDVLAGFITLDATGGSVGSAANPLDVGVTDPLGRIEATSDSGQGVYLNGPLGAQFNVGNISSGDAVWLSSDLSALIDGTVTGPGPISLVSGGTMTLSPKADVHATTLGVFLRAGGLVMQDAQRMIDNGETLDPKYAEGDAAQIRVNVGTIDLETTGDALITGIETGNGTESAIRVVSTAGSILDNGDTRLDIIADTAPAAKLIIGAAGQIGGNPLDVRLLNLESVSGGLTHINAQGSVNVVSVDAGGEVLLNAGVSGAGSINGGAISSTGGPIRLAASGGGVNLARVSGPTGVSVAGETGVVLGVVNVGTTLELAGPGISANVFGGSGPVGGSVTGFGGGMATNVNLTLSGAGGFFFDDFWAATAGVSIPYGPLSIGNAIIRDRAIFANPQTLVLVDQHNRSIQSADVQLYSAGDPFSMYLNGNSLATNSFVIHRSPWHEVITPAGTNTSVVEEGEYALAKINRALPMAESEEEEEDGVLVKYAGVPVALECKLELDPECVK